MEMPVLGRSLHIALPEIHLFASGAF